MSREPNESKRRHKLLTTEMRNEIPALYSQDGKPPEDVPIAVKFFSPFSSWSWFATEGESRGDDFIFFGMVHGFERELGYFMLSELAEATDESFGGAPAVERDCYYGDHFLSEVSP